MGLVDEVLAAVGDDGPATIRVAGDEITVELPGGTVGGQRLDHDFPDYRRILHGRPPTGWTSTPRRCVPSWRRPHR